MSSTPFPTARRRGLVVQQVRNELLVYDLDNDRAHCLNETAAAIWRACDGKSHLLEIRQNVSAYLQTEIAGEVVQMALGELSEHDLLENKSDFTFNPISRREVIRKIGIASMAALPIVTSLAVPKSVMAATSCSCVTAIDCLLQSGCPIDLCLLPVGVCQ